LKTCSAKERGGCRIWRGKEAYAVGVLERQTRIVGVRASGAPAMARSYTAGHAVSAEAHTIATAIAITDPIPESLARLIALVDEIVLVDDDDLRSAQQLIHDTLNVTVEPAGAAGVAALARHGDRLTQGRTAALLTGADPKPGAQDTSGERTQ
jgi:threonine dehydratase